MFGDDEDIRSDRDQADDYKAGMERQDRLITVMQLDLDRKHAEIVRLREFIRSQALCPCCEQYEQCVPGCTFRDDSVTGWEEMDAARAVLSGDDGPA